MIWLGGLAGRIGNHEIGLGEAASAFRAAWPIERDVGLV